MADDKEAVEDTEGDRGHGEEVHCRNRFPVIRKKRAPALGWPELSRNPLRSAGDASLAEIEAQPKQFAMNARRAAVWVLRHHTENQLPNFRRQFFPTDLFSRLEIKLQYSRKPARCQQTTVSGLTKHESLLPSTPETAGKYPEDFVTRLHPGSGMLAFQHGQLLPESEIFQEQASTRLQAAREQAQP